jgi:hypothetical protein
MSPLGSIADTVEGVLRPSSPVGPQASSKPRFCLVVASPFSLPDGLRGKAPIMTAFFFLLPAFLVLPHPCRDIALFLPQGVGIDRRHFQAGMAHPLGEHVERHPFGDRVHPEAVAQALGALVGAVGDPCRLQDLLDAQEGRGASPGPQGAVRNPLPAAAVRLDEAVCRVQDIQATVRHRHGPVHAATALLEGFENDGLAGQIDTAGGERQGLADPAAGIGLSVICVQKVPLREAL